MRGGLMMYILDVHASVAFCFLWGVLFFGLLLGKRMDGWKPYTKCTRPGVLAERLQGMGLLGISVYLFLFFSSSFSAFFLRDLFFKRSLFFSLAYTV
jgi:hypothetical protein